MEFIASKNSSGNCDAFLSANSFFITRFLICTIVRNRNMNFHYFVSTYLFPCHWSHWLFGREMSVLLKWIVLSDFIVLPQYSLHCLFLEFFEIDICSRNDIFSGLTSYAKIWCKYNAKRFDSKLEFLYLNVYLNICMCYYILPKRCSSNLTWSKFWTVKNLWSVYIVSFG